MGVLFRRCLFFSPSLYPLRIWVDKLNSPELRGPEDLCALSSVQRIHCIHADVCWTPQVEFIRLQEEGFDLHLVASSGVTRRLITFPVCDSLRQHARTQKSTVAGPFAGTGVLAFIPCNVSCIFRFSSYNAAVHPAGHHFRSFESFQSY